MLDDRRAVVDAGPNGAIVGNGGLLLWDGMARRWYQIQASELDLGIPGAMYRRNRLKHIAYDRLSPHGKSLTDFARLSRKDQLLGKTSQELQLSAGFTSHAWNRLGLAARMAGTVLLVGAATRSAYVVLNAPSYDRRRAVMVEAGCWGGGVAGSYLGARAGLIVAATVLGRFALGGLAGVVVGGIVGGVIGGSIGSTSASRAVDLAEI